ncbi:MAG: molybdenum ABC transporter ATP-binding protein [Proteobacteria bacterium]|nr:molybdenum ABC transporter ATP-binding protein [Pseudomonadota bacterium]MBS0572210.1 molybdenum ABC transporter ATP-binding protein [Pseudomonadota bacterium]
MAGLDLSFRLDRGTFRLEIDRTLPAEGLTAIFGPSGAGKSSLLRAVAGFERTGGRIAFQDEIWEDGRRFLAPHLRRVGYVFQEPRLFAHLDVAGNLAYAARRAGMEGESAGMVRRFGLGPLLGRRTGQLSGGEAQRVALVRALLGRPRLLLMDEPLSALDAARRAEILPLIEELRDEGRLPILFVSHAIAEVARLAERVLGLAGGRVTGFGTVAEIFSDREAGAAFGDEEAVSLIEARHEAVEADGLSRLTFAGGTILVPALPVAAGRRVRLLIRARDVMIATGRPEGLSALNILSARVRSLTDLGTAACDVRLDCGGALLLARITRRSARALGLAPGVACHAILKSVALAHD